MAETLNDLLQRPLYGKITRVLTAYHQLIDRI